MTELILQVLGVSALSAFGVVGFIQWLKQLNDTLPGPALALLNIGLCAVTSVAAWHGVFSAQKIGFIILLLLSTLTFTQLGYEGLVKPLFEKVLGK